jgi:hypothetical protein
MPVFSLFFLQLLVDYWRTGNCLEIITFEKYPRCKKKLNKSYFYLVASNNLSKPLAATSVVIKKVMLLVNLTRFFRRYFWCDWARRGRGVTSSTENRLVSLLTQSIL